ncbi:hypothetical protein ABT237_13650 [Streptomyces sp. NPDC001581]|uniref:hypothetical protein n=1 Tax=Streptomyces sp. NPDC001581 TaxID=3154386 RepID=UPI0033268E51
MQEIGTIWILMAGTDEHRGQAGAWVNGGYCATDYHLAGDIPANTGRAGVLSALTAGYPGEDADTVSTWATQLAPFLADERVGEWVLIPDGDTVHIGTITGPATYVGPGPGARYARRRTVDWRIRDVPRTSLPRYATQILGTFQRNKAERNRAPVVALIQAHLENEASPVLVGVPYREADRNVTPAPAALSAPDPALTTTALRTHATLQNGLAEAVRARGLIPRSPDGEPRYDLAITDEAGEQLTLCEIKSLPEGAETAQLRAGVAQLLDYADHFRDEEQLRRLLWVERAPAEAERWTRICAAAGIVLGWPGAEGRVLGPMC